MHKDLTSAWFGFLGTLMKTLRMASNNNGKGLYPCLMILVMAGFFQANVFGQSSAH